MFPFRGFPKVDTPDLPIQRYQQLQSRILEDEQKRDQIRTELLEVELADKKGVSDSGRIKILLMEENLKQEKLKTKLLHLELEERRRAVPSKDS